MNLSSRFFFLLKTKWISIFCWSQFTTIFSNKEYSSFMFRKNYCSYQLTTFPGRLTDALTHLKNCFLGNNSQALLWGTLLSPQHKASQTARCRGITIRVLFKCRFNSNQPPVLSTLLPTHCKKRELVKNTATHGPHPEIQFKYLHNREWVYF